MVKGPDGVSSYWPLRFCIQNIKQNKKINIMKHERTKRSVLSVCNTLHTHDLNTLQWKNKLNTRDQMPMRYCRKTIWQPYIKSHCNSFYIATFPKLCQEMSPTLLRFYEARNPQQRCGSRVSFLQARQLQLLEDPFFYAANAFRFWIFDAKYVWSLGLGCV